ncbi:hypothetical protein V6N13_013083 [Hibiscus sabdariffa]|uniref:Uncharacterized protein n=1 Tax=Hibiscus sabdariffa TaxID=183260 RepID=A0ABR2SH41_9ROSI
MESNEAEEERESPMTPWEQHAKVISIPRFDYKAPSSLLQRSHSVFLITCTISTSTAPFTHFLLSSLLSLSLKWGFDVFVSLLSERERRALRKKQCLSFQRKRRNIEAWVVNGREKQEAIRVLPLRANCWLLK